MSLTVVAGVAQAVVIDDLTTPQTLSAGTGSSVAQGTVATGGGSLGGARTVILTRDPSSSGSDSIAIGAAGAGADIASSFCCSAAIWTLDYALTVPMDLTEGGTVDRLRFVVQASSELAVSATLLTSDTAQSFAEAQVGPSAAPGVIDLPFASFVSSPYDPPDLQHIARVVIQFGFFSTHSQPLTARISAIETVPEPAGLALLALGALRKLRPRRVIRGE